MSNSSPLLKWIILFGFCLRFCFVIFSNHIYYPDEIFQTLEPGLRLIKGYSLIAWDVAYGLRSWWFISFSSLPLALFQSFSTTTIHLSTKIWFALFSLSLIPASFYLALDLFKRQAIAKVAAFAVAIWYELIYFAPRAFSETMSVNLLALSFLATRLKSPLNYSAGVFWIIGLLLRPQYAVVFLVLGWYILKRQKFFSFTSSVLLGIVLMGLADIAVGYPFLGFLATNLRLSFFNGASSVFGTKPGWYYFVALIGTSGGLFLLSLFSSRNKIVWLILIVIGVHSLIPHKEYRFIYLVIPLILVLVSGFFRSSTKTILIISLLSILGFASQLPLRLLAYPQPILFQDPYLKILSHISQDDSICGLYHKNRHWVYTGGLYSLNKPIASYDKDNQATASAYNAIISTNQIIASDYALKDYIHPYYLYTRSGTCDANAATYYRSFPQIEDLL